jgi:tetrapyrrole methylase family protein/MazG family protein
VSENCQTSAGETQQGTSCAPLAGETFAAFVDTIAALRAPNGCPWDREQTHESIARNMIEEAYEAVDAIEQHDATHLREELGDVLLQVVLQSQIAADAQAEEPEGLLDSVPASFPALLQAYKISRKAVAAGFEWDTVEDVWAKVEEEIAEFKQACRSDDAQAKELEFGDVLFSLVNVARKEGIDAETALRATCRKFRERWAFMEGAAWGQGKRIEELDMDEMQQLWDQAKMLHVGEASHD